MSGQGQWGWSSSNSQGRYSHARRDYKCDKCGGTIKKGEFYHASRPAFSYSPRTEHYHFGKCPGGTAK